MKFQVVVTAVLGPSDLHYILGKWIKIVMPIVDVCDNANGYSCGHGT